MRSADFVLSTLLEMLVLEAFRKSSRSTLEAVTNSIAAQGAKSEERNPAQGSRGLGEVCAFSTEREK